MRRAEAAAGLVTLAFGAFVVVQARALEDPGLDAIGPGAIPTALGLVIAGSGLVLLVQALVGRRADATESEPARWGLLGTAVLLLLAYVHGIEWLGFPLATALFVTANLVLLGTRGLPRLVVAGIAISLVVTLAFGRLLGVDLPAGRLFG